MFDEAEILTMSCNIMGNVLLNEQAEINCFTGHSESINSKASPNFGKMVVFIISFGGRLQCKRGALWTTTPGGRGYD